MSPEVSVGRGRSAARGLLATLALSVAASGSVGAAGAGSIEFRQLRGVDLDGWTRALIEGAPAGSPGSVTEITRAIVRAARADQVPDPGAAPASDDDRLRAFAGRLRPLARKFADAAGYRRLQTAFREAGRKLRLTVPTRLAARILYLLDVLGDEVMYARQIRFDEHADFTWGDIRDVRAGDVLASKQTEFTSLLVQLRSPDAGAYSHAQLAVQGGPPGTPELLESGTFGLERVPFRPETSARLAVFRPVRSADVAARRSGFAAFIARARARGAGDLRRAYPFDFTFHPDCAAARYFCTEMIYCVHQAAGVPEADNPYARAGWESATEAPLPFIAQVMALNWGAAPLPSQIAVSAAFAPVGYAVRADQLAALRDHLAVVEAFAALMRAEPGLFEKYLAALDRLTQHRKVGELRVDDIRALGRAGVLDPGRVLAVRGALPGDLDARALVFYYHFESVLMPRAIRALRDPACPRGWHTLGEAATIMRSRLAAEIRRFADR